MYKKNKKFDPRDKNFSYLEKAFMNYVEEKLQTSVVLKSKIFAIKEHPHPSALLSDFPVVKTIVAIAEQIGEFLFQRHKISSAEKLVQGVPAAVSTFLNKFLPFVMDSIHKNKLLMNDFVYTGPEDPEKFYTFLGEKCAKTLITRIECGVYKLAMGIDDAADILIKTLIETISRDLADEIHNMARASVSTNLGIGDSDALVGSYDGCDLGYDMSKLTGEEDEEHQIIH